MKKEFEFCAKVWIYPGVGGWHFVTLPKDLAEEVDFFWSHAKRGWGSLPVMVTIGETEWRTSIFTDKKSESYILPIKVAVRKKESIHEEKEIKILIEIKA